MCHQKICSTIRVSGLSIEVAWPGASPQEVEEQIVRELKFEGNKPRKMPNFDKNEANVKLNVAALKREKHLIDLEEREAKEKLD